MLKRKMQLLAAERWAIFCLAGFYKAPGGPAWTCQRDTLRTLGLRGAGAFSSQRCSHLTSANTLSLQSSSYTYSQRAADFTIVTFIKIKVSRGGFHSDALEEPFCFLKQPDFS